MSTRGKDRRPRRAAQPESTFEEPLPSNLHDLLRRAQDMSAAGAEQKAVFSAVCQVAEHYGIRVRHDQIPPATSTKVADATATAAAAAAATDAAADDVATNVAPGSADATTDAASDATIDATATDQDEDLTASSASVASSDKTKRERRTKMRLVPAPIVRLPNGSHQLRLSELFSADTIESEASEAAAPEDEEAPRIGRLVLSVDKETGKPHRGAPLNFECNGVVVDAVHWRALAVPPCAFNLSPRVQTVNTHLANGWYDIIKVDDGTVVTLYSWDHPTAGKTWALASSNGYDVSSLRWTGPLTYAEVFYDLAVRLYPKFAESTGLGLTKSGGATRLTFTNLDPTRCYTLGFRHHNFHPMTSDPERMWQIQYADLSGPTPQVRYAQGDGGGGLPGIPEQALLSAAELERNKVPMTVEGLTTYGNHANSTAAPKYGFILRSRASAQTRDHSDILIETALLTRIRKLAYERPPAIVQEYLTAQSRLEYSAMRAFLTATERSDFVAYFPEWKPRFDLYTEFTNNVVTAIIHALRQKAMAPMTAESKTNTPTSLAAREILRIIMSTETLNAFHVDTESVVRDYVVNPEYALLFLLALRPALRPTPRSTPRPTPHRR